MVIDHELLPFFEWLLPTERGLGAFAVFFFALLIGTLLALFFSYIFAALRHGPGEGFYAVASVVFQSAVDFWNTSFRRVLAMSRLAVKESWRGRVAVVFIIFVVVLMYARWFLDVKTDHPGKLYLSFVMTATNYLVILLALFLSTFSLPSDIKNRTIYTVVTKPVRPGEIVIGRILGFGFVGTVILAVMGVTSYFFVTTSLDHTHELDADLADVREAIEQDGEWIGQTTEEDFHRHTITINDKGEVKTDVVQDHFHTGRFDGETLVLGPPQGQLVAREPLYGTLRFLNRSGGPADSGINVGKEWSYRSYIEGKTRAAAIWTFDGVTPERFPDKLPLELTLSIFRTYKGDIEKGVQGSITVVNPNRSARIRRSAPIPFEGKEFVTDRQDIPRKLQAMGSDGSTLPEIDIFENLVDDGKVEIWVKCEDPSQYFGMAQGDAYLRAADRSFAVNYAKGFIGTWLQMLIVTSFGVMFSTFLSGAISMLATVAVVVLGRFTTFITGILGGMIASKPFLARLLGQMPSEQLSGGGPIESMIRMVRQMNLTAELELGWVTETIITNVDLFLISVMALFSKVLPRFGFFDTSRYVAYGFSISNDLLAQQCLTAFAFCLMLSLIGYFFLKTREIAA